jgi:RNA-directed DNA polymerase
MLRFLEHRIADRRVLRLIRKWLTAGVVENGYKTDALVGTPQGAVISPLLANIYLHYVFDLWVQRWRRRDAHGVNAGQEPLLCDGEAALLSLVMFRAMAC